MPTSIINTALLGDAAAKDIRASYAHMQPESQFLQFESDFLKPISTPHMLFKIGTPHAG